jgi:hypothetical protein
MDSRRATWRRAAAAILMTLGLAAGGAGANSVESPFVKAGLVQVDVFDRADAAALPVYAKHGRNYIVGTPGHEYALRIRNCSNRRVLAVTSVDGINVISGDTAAPSQSGYVLDPWGSVEIAGWRKSMDRTAAFYFTDLGDSYAARTGRPQNVGVVGVAVFQEKSQPIAGRDFHKDLGASGEPIPAPSTSRQESAAGSVAEEDSLESARKSPGKLGTGHGRSEDSLVTMVAFERATDWPAETVAIQYDRRESLAAMGVLPRHYYADRHQPDPFPGAMRFAPDPPR